MLQFFRISTKDTNNHHLSIGSPPRLANRSFSAFIIILIAAVFSGLLPLPTEVNAQEFLDPSPLAPIKTDHPRDTMRTFIANMNKVREARAKKDDQAASAALKRATRTLQLGRNVLDTNLEGERAAQLLKETIDRVIVINYSLIPDDTTLNRWRLKGTEISIVKVPDGEYRAGEFLFSAETVGRAQEFFDVVSPLPYLPKSGKGALFKGGWIENNVPSWLQGKTFGMFHWQWFGILFAIICGFVVRIVIEYAVTTLKKIATRSSSEWDDNIISATEGPIGTIAAAALWYVALKILAIDGTAQSVLLIAIQIVFSISLIWLFLNFTDVATSALQRYARRTDVPIDDQLVPLIRRACRLFVALFGILVSIQNLGVNVMSLLAGLGLGGLAFALAAKDTAANLFGSIMILWDQPFKVGDWIRSGGNEGTVEEIGFRSTRIRTFYDSQISIPNSELANAHIDNLGRRKFRREKFTIGLTYDTAPDKLEKFIDGVKAIIKDHPKTRKDNFHVVFEQFGASSLDILVYFFLEVPDWAEELKEKQDIHLKILKAASSLKVDFAFPSRSIYMHSPEST